MSEQSNGIQQNKGVWSSPSPTLVMLGTRKWQKHVLTVKVEQGRCVEVSVGILRENNVPINQVK